MENKCLDKKRKLCLIDCSKSQPELSFIIIIMIGEIIREVYGDSDTIIS